MAPTRTETGGEPPSCRFAEIRRAKNTLLGRWGRRSWATCLQLSTEKMLGSHPSCTSISFQIRENSQQPESQSLPVKAYFVWFCLAVNHDSHEYVLYHRTFWNVTCSKSSPYFQNLPPLWTERPSLQPGPTPEVSDYPRKEGGSVFLFFLYTCQKKASTSPTRACRSPPFVGK